jgi:hypothetical protein
MIFLHAVNYVSWSGRTKRHRQITRVIVSVQLHSNEALSVKRSRVYVWGGGAWSGAGGKVGDGCHYYSVTIQALQRYVLLCVAELFCMFPQLEDIKCGTIQKTFAYWFQM